MAKGDAHGLQFLLTAAQRGDATALAELIGRLRGLCQALARSWLGYELSRQQGADSDVAQEASLGVSRQFPTFRGRTAAELVAWVRTITYGAAVDWKRRRNLPLTGAWAVEPTAPDPPPPEQAERAEEVARVFAALERLPARRREVVELHLIDRLPHAKAAEQLGASEGAVRVLYVRALEQLRELLKESDA